MIKSAIEKKSEEFKPPFLGEIDIAGDAVIGLFTDSHRCIIVYSECKNISLGEQLSFNPHHITLVKDKVILSN